MADERVILCYQNPMKGLAANYLIRAFVILIFRFRLLITWKLYRSIVLHTSRQTPKHHVIAISYMSPILADRTIAPFVGNGTYFGNYYII